MFKVCVLAHGEYPEKGINVSASLQMFEGTLYLLIGKSEVIVA